MQGHQGSFLFDMVRSLNKSCIKSSINGELMSPFIIQLTFVCTGETEWTMSGRYTGSSDIPLTKNGEKQVSTSAQVIVGPGKIIDPSRLAHLFVSPRTRARRTFDVLFDENSQKQLLLKTEISEDIREWEYGAYEGLLTAQIRAARKQRGLDEERPWNIWVDGCEDGESASEVSVRLDRIIDKIRK